MRGVQLLTHDNDNDNDIAIVIVIVKAHVYARVCNYLPISQIPQCIRQVSHNAPFITEMCTCVHISVTKWCIVGYGTGALWDLWNGFITYSHAQDNVVALKPLSINRLASAKRRNSVANALELYVLLALIHQYLIKIEVNAYFVVMQYIYDRNEGLAFL